MTWVSMTRQLGSSGPTVFPLALGCMGMSGIYGKSEDDESVERAIPATAVAGTRYDEHQMKMLDSERGKRS